MARTKLETEFAADLKDKLKERFPGCMIMKLDPNQIQGIPDLLVLHEDNWATLETKRAFSSSKRPNQPHYVAKMNDMSFSAFINPENCEEVLDALQSAFGSEG